MTNHVSTLNVLLYGEPIATITNVGNDRTLFAFMDSYIHDESRPVLGLGFKDSLGGLLTNFKPTQTKLTPFFSNLLPEETMRHYLAERAGVNPAREFFLLWVLGQDLAGAITVEPADGEALPPNVQQDIDDETKIDVPMRFSLAGVQLKFSAVQQANGGLTIPATGQGGSWIVKLPSSRFDAVPENEYSMMELARMLGMDVPETQLLPINQIANIPDGIGKFGDAFKNAQAFVIKRFDRAGDQAVHIEDFAQVFGVYPQDKYKKASMRNIAQVLIFNGRHGGGGVNGRHFHGVFVYLLDDNVAGQHRADLVFRLQGLISKVRVAGAQDEIGPEIFTQLLFEGLLNIDLADDAEAVVFERPSDLSGNLLHIAFYLLAKVVCHVVDFGCFLCIKQVQASQRSKAQLITCVSQY